MPKKTVSQFKDIGILIGSDNNKEVSASQKDSSHAKEVDGSSREQEYVALEKQTISSYNLTSKEESQVLEYIKIYKNESFEKHWQANNYITNNNLWDSFSEIRSLNDHGDHKRIPGILPKFYGIVCQLLNIGGSNGAPLDKSEKY